MSSSDEIWISLWSILVVLTATTLVELTHAYRSKSIRTLWNIYTFGYTLAVLTLVLRLTVIHISPETPFYLIMFYLVIVDYSVLYLFDVYAFIRMIHLLDVLIGKDPSYETIRKRLGLCRFAAWAFGVIIIIRASPFILLWLFELLGYYNM